MPTMKTMKALSPEQVLAVADEVCAARKVHVRSFAAVAACAAVPGARVRGVPVFDNVDHACAELAATARAVAPLTGDNELFADLLAAVYRKVVALDDPF